MNPHTANKLTEASNFAPQSGPLAAANQGFHETYNRLVNESMTQLGHTVPIIALIGDYLHLLADDREQSDRILPDRYHQLKCFGHLAFGLHLSLMANGFAPLSRETRRELEQKLIQLQNALQGVEGFPKNEQLAPTTLVHCSAELIDQVLASGTVDAARLQDYAKTVVPLVSEVAGCAVRLEIDLLHRSVSKWHEQLDDERWQQLYVVICDNHQPRYRHAARQYFGRLLHEDEGIAAELEDRIIFGEGIPDVDGALDLVARHVIDQKASKMLFGDKSRLQKDLLADVATAYLDTVFPTAK